MHLENLGKDIEEVRRVLDKREDAQTECLKHMRECVRAAGKSINSVHSGDLKSAAGFLSQAKKSLLALRRVSGSEFEHHVLHSEQEFSEAFCLYSLVAKRTLPSRAELGVSEVSYLNSLCDLVGEVRRHMLNLLIAGRLEEGKHAFSAMEIIHGSLSVLKYSDSIAPELRRKTDVARMQTEQARSELFMAELKLR